MTYLKTLFFKLVYNASQVDHRFESFGFICAKAGCWRDSITIQVVCEREMKKGRQKRFQNLNPHIPYVPLILGQLHNLVSPAKIFF